MSIKIDQSFFQEMIAEKAFFKRGGGEETLFDMFLKSLIIFVFIV